MIHSVITVNYVRQLLLGFGPLGHYITTTYYITIVLQPHYVTPTRLIYYTNGLFNCKNELLTPELTRSQS